VLNNEVHPYDLLRYERAIFSRPAIESLQESLKKTVSKRQTTSTPVQEPVRKTRRKKAEVA
jgi:hypothetical protein